MSLIQDLLDFEQTLLEWIINLQPRNDDDRQLMLELVAARDSLTDTVDALVAKRLQIAALGMTEEIQKINAIIADVKNEKQAIDAVGKIVKAVCDVAGFAASVLAKV